MWTGLPVTVSVAAAPALSTEAPTRVVPAASPVARPVPETVATVAFELDQDIGTPEIGLPAASFATAVNCAVAPGAMESTTGLTVTEATCGLTRRLLVPTVPAASAVMVAEPLSLAVTNPVPSTLATSGRSLAQATERKNSRRPRPSSRAAVNRDLLPGNKASVAGVTDTEATGSFRTALQVPVEPSLQETVPLTLEAGVPVACPV